jgi:hypothetical protein
MLHARAGSRYLLAAGLAVLVLCGGTLANRASAHEESAGEIVVTLDPVPARLARVRVQLQRTLADQLLIENRTRTPLEVLDDHGVPFLRIGPAGAEANLAAPMWYQTVAPDGVPVPTTAHVGAPPDWKRVGSDPTWGWFDRRLRASTVPEATRGARSRAEVGRWTIPLRFGNAPVGLRGRFRSTPPRTGTFEAHLTSTQDPFPGVRVTLVPGRVPALYLENAGDEPIVVRGAAGEPFLRIGPDGASANVRSPTWQLSGRAEVVASAPPVDAHAPPAWQVQSPTPRFAWIEFRAAPPMGEPHDLSHRTTLRRWAVMLQRGSVTARVSGVVDWVPRPPLHDG